MKKTTGCFAPGCMHAQPCAWELMLLIGSFRARLQHHIEVQYVPDFMVRHLTHMNICMTGKLAKYPKSVQSVMPVMPAVITGDASGQLPILVLPHGISGHLVHCFRVGTCENLDSLSCLSLLTAGGSLCKGQQTCKHWLLIVQPQTLPNHASEHWPITTGPL